MARDGGVELGPHGGLLFRTERSGLRSALSFPQKIINLKRPWAERSKLGKHCLLRHSLFQHSLTKRHRVGHDYRPDYNSKALAL